MVSAILLKTNHRITFNPSDWLDGSLGPDKERFHDDNQRIIKSLGVHVNLCENNFLSLLPDRANDIKPTQKPTNNNQFVVFQKYGTLGSVF